MFLEFTFNRFASRLAKPAGRVSLLDEDFVCDNEPSPVPPQVAIDSLQVRLSDLELLRQYSSDACSAEVE